VHWKVWPVSNCTCLLHEVDEQRTRKLSAKSELNVWMNMQMAYVQSGEYLSASRGRASAIEAAKPNLEAWIKTLASSGGPFLWLPNAA